MQLTHEAALVEDGELGALIREANELVAILTAAIKTAKLREVTSCGERDHGAREMEESQVVGTSALFSITGLPRA